MRLGLSRKLDGDAVAALSEQVAYRALDPSSLQFEVDLGWRVADALCALRSGDVALLMRPMPAVEIDLTSAGKQILEAGAARRPSYAYLDHRRACIHPLLEDLADRRALGCAADDLAAPTPFECVRRQLGDFPALDPENLALLAGAAHRRLRRPGRRLGDLVQEDRHDDIDGQLGHRR